MPADTGRGASVNIANETTRLRRIGTAMPVDSCTTLGQRPTMGSPTGEAHHLTFACLTFRSIFRFDHLIQYCLYRSRLAGGFRDFSWIWADRSTMLGRKEDAVHPQDRTTGTVYEAH